MGIEKNIGFDKFPKQGSYLGKDVEVCFNYNTSKKIMGKIVRDDSEEPFKTIIKLQNENYLLATECQYRLLD